MRSFLLIAVSAVSGSVLTLFFLLPPATVGAGASADVCSAQNGDVNADGTINIADATTILGFLFLGTPAVLVPTCPPGPAPSSLPDTAQKKCYGGANDPVVADCSAAKCPGQDASYNSGCPSEGRFTDNGDGTLSDNCTGLMWQKDSADTDGDGAIESFEDILPWCEALAYCAKLTLAGHNDWRLPNVRELESIVDYGDQTMIDPAFGVTLPQEYWCSTTTHESLSSYAWAIRFGITNPHISVIQKNVGLHVRAVRTAQ